MFDFTESMKRGFFADLSSPKTLCNAVTSMGSPTFGNLEVSHCPTHAYWIRDLDRDFAYFRTSTVRLYVPGIFRIDTCTSIYRSDKGFLKHCKRLYLRNTTFPKRNEIQGTVKFIPCA